MPSEHEIPMLVRRFTGIDRSQDPAFIGPAALQTSDNFAPSLTFLLSKRQGETLLRNLQNDVGGGFPLTAFPTLVRAYDDAGNRYLLAVIKPFVGPDDFVHSLNDATFLDEGAVSKFATSGTFYGTAQLGNTVYVGNGVDPLKAAALGSPVTTTDDPFFIASPGTSAGGGGGGDPTTPADPNSAIQDGTYSFAWVVYNSVTKKWTRRFDTRTFNDATAGDHNLTFTSPQTVAGGGVYTLAVNELFHLFLGPRNLPIELASDQSPQGVGNLATVVVRQVSTDGTAIPIVGASRRGNLLVGHRNRLWVSGDQTAGNASRVYATSIVLPGNEQSLFDIQPYFPTKATLNVGRQDGDRVTALGRAALTVTTESPDAPLLIFKNTQTWAFFGDILDDPNAQLLQLSAVIGCPAPLSVVETPLGTVFVGLESVYLVRPDQLVPVDIGAPINTLIRQIPVNRRSASCAFYHRGFYKLAITPIGSTKNTVQLWLDLRQGLSPRSWWGPHSGPPVIAFANARQDPLEIDRGLDLQSQGNIRRVDQDSVYTDLVDDIFGTTQPIISRLKTASLDLDTPFDRKHFTRLRANGRTNALATSVGIQLAVDGGMAFGEPPLTFTGSGGGAAWNSATWNVSNWTSPPTFHEAEAIFSPDRPRGVSIDVTLTHSDAVPLDLRDVEIRELPVGRPVA